MDPIASRLVAAFVSLHQQQQRDQALLVPRGCQQPERGSIVEVAILAHKYTDLWHREPEKLVALAAIDAVGDDFFMKTGMCGKGGQKVPVGTGQGHVRIGAMTVGGTEV